MHLKIISAGQRLPEWVNSGFETYRKRFPREMRLELVEIPWGKSAQGIRPRHDVSRVIVCWVP